MILTFIILAITISFFIWGKVRPDLIAFLSMLSLVLTGVLDVGQALQGFSATAVVMIAALFVVSGGLTATGVTAWLGNALLKVTGDSESRLLTVLMLGTAVLSGFISNTGVVAMLLPAVIGACYSIGANPAKLLMPLAFAANMGGMLTMIGTPPNIIVNQVLSDTNEPMFGFFEFALIGFPLLVSAILFIVVFGKKILPEGSSLDGSSNREEALEKLAATYHVSDKLFTFTINRNSRAVGQDVAELKLSEFHGVSLLQINRSENGNEKTYTPTSGSSFTVGAGDVLTVKGDEKEIEEIALNWQLVVDSIDLTVGSESGALFSPEYGIAELLVTPRSEYIGKTIMRGSIGEKYGAQFLAVRRQKNVVDEHEITLEPGDSLLIRARWKAIELFLNERQNFIVLGNPKEMAYQVMKLTAKAWYAIGALSVMVLLMLTGTFPAVTCALIGASLMVIGGCLNMEEVYRTINWQSVVLIASMMPMGTALQVTGGAEWIAGNIVSAVAGHNPLFLLGGVFLLTTAFSQVISNTATAVLVAPIVMAAAGELGISPYPVLMAVAISASTAFLTPIGTTTNVLVMVPGGYSFADYFKLGAPITVMFLIMTLLIVPLIWPF